MLLAVALQLGFAFPAEPRLERARGIVEASVDDTAVVPRLVGGDRGLAFENRQSEARSKAKELERCREPHDAGTDDSDVVGSSRTWRNGHAGLSARTRE
jgi:hypothetical protein